MIYTVTLNTAIDRIVKIRGELTRKFNNKSYETIIDVGGKATHVAMALSDLGFPTLATGFIGGETGQVMVKIMEEHGVHCEFIDQAGDLTRESIILVDESNKGSFMITQPGFAIKEESFKRLTRYLEANINAEDMIVFSGTPPLDFSIDWYSELLALINTKGAKLVVDAAGDYLRQALKYTPYLVKPNEFEFQEYIGKKLENIDEYAEELARLDSDVDYWVVSLGKRGSLLKLADNEIYYCQAPDIVEINETGAGDFFVAGLCAQLYLGAGPEKMLRYASAIGASKASQFESAAFDKANIELLMQECCIERVR